MSNLHLAIAWTAPGIFWAPALSSVSHVAITVYGVQEITNTNTCSAWKRGNKTWIWNNNKTWMSDILSAFIKPFFLPAFDLFSSALFEYCIFVDLLRIYSFYYDQEFIYFYYD